jgi:hypothetical protein
MSKEIIKDELIKEISKRYLQPTGEKNSLQELSNKLDNYSEFEDKVFDVLNSILDKHGIDLEDEIEKQEFIEFIKPTITELIEKYITR